MVGERRMEVGGWVGALGRDEGAGGRVKEGKDKRIRMSGINRKMGQDCYGPS